MAQEIERSHSPEERVCLGEPWGSENDSFIQEGSRIVPLGWFMLRTPARPFDSWLNWTRQADCLSVDGSSALETAVADCKQQLRASLRDRLDARFLEAIYFASSSLSTEIPKWIKEPAMPKGEGVEASLVAYFTRATSRSTPFGVFSTVSTGTVSEKTNFGLSGDLRVCRKTQVGLPYLRRFFKSMVADQSWRGALQYVPNPTIRARNGRLHYLKNIETNEGQSVYVAARCSLTGVLEHILKISDSGTTIDDLVRQLAKDSVIDAATFFDQVRKFVDRLVEAQILLPLAGPVISGADPGSSLIELTKARDNRREVRNELLTVVQDLERLDLDGPGASVDPYRAIASQLPHIHDSPEQNTSDLFFLDLYRSEPSLSLGKDVVSEIFRSIGLLSSISSQNDSTWDRFAEMFSERFGDDEVPLLDLFESDFRFSFEDAAPKRQWDERDRYLLQKVAKALEEQKAVLQLSESDVTFLKRSDAGKLPTCFAVVCSVLARSDIEISQGKYHLIIEGISRAAALMGRFAWLGQEWREKIERFARAEQELCGDSILADVVYEPPEKRGANVICRPALTEYVIPFFGTTSLPRQQHIRLSELTVTVRGNKVVLWSTRLQKEVIPVHNTAYAFHHPGNPMLLRFLSKLAMGTCNVAWHWGEVLESLPFLPRLHYDRLIISRARWKLQSSELAEIQGPDAVILKKMEELRHRRRMPRFISLLQGDKRLSVDLRNILSLKMFLRLTRHQVETAVTEMVPSEEHLCVSSPEGRFHHELVIPAVIAPRASAVQKRQPRSIIPIQERLLPPNSEWLYTKIYLPPHSADEFLANPLSELLHHFESEQIASKWFFIRYRDPYHHLRIRIRVSHPELGAIVFDRLSRYLNPLQLKGVLWKWQVDFYEREVDRYGGVAGMIAAEKIFSADSAMALGALKWLSISAKNEELRRALCLVSLDEILNDFNVSLHDKQAIMEELCSALKPTFEHHKQMEIQFGKLIREERRKLMGSMMRVQSEFSGSLSARSALVQREAMALARLEEQQALTRHLPALIKSFLHMNLNRLMNAGTTKEEWMHYEWLRRLYSSCHGQGLTTLDELYKIEQSRTASERRRRTAVPANVR
jgi:class I lanthipeptide synthase